MGLLARFFEKKGIPTASVYLQESMAQQVPAPRMIQADWPFGHPYGEPGKPAMQAMMIHELLERFEVAQSFGDLHQPDWPWHRTEVTLPDSWKDSIDQEIS